MDFAPKPAILMFDEATSAIDNLTQKTVSDSLNKLKCIRIVIVHRLPAIKSCDRIVWLKDSGSRLPEKAGNARENKRMQSRKSDM